MQYEIIEIQKGSKGLVTVLTSDVVSGPSTQSWNNGFKGPLTQYKTIQQKGLVIHDCTSILLAMWGHPKCFVPFLDLQQSWGGVSGNEATHVHNTNTP